MQNYCHGFGYTVTFVTFTFLWDQLLANMLAETTLLTDDPWLVPVFLVIAILYSASGFGGGSSYLAFLSLASPQQGVVRALAYFCNIAVTSLSSFRFAKRGWLVFKDAWPWVAGALPFAFAGGSIRLSNTVYLSLLGVALVVAALLMFLQRTSAFTARTSTTKSTDAEDKPLRRIDQWYVRLLISASIGLLSGLVGIGGGIFLSPILHLSRWREPLRIAGVSAVFILANASVGAVAYVLRNGLTVGSNDFMVLVGTVLVGSYLGSSFSLSPSGRKWIRALTAVLILIVGVRILINQLIS